jgi:hypothetical protein
MFGGWKREKRMGEFQAMRRVGGRGVVFPTMKKQAEKKPAGIQHDSGGLAYKEWNRNKLRFLTASFGLILRHKNLP